MPSPLRILLDCDGVIADFITPAIAAAERVSSVKLAYEDVVDHHMQNLLPEQHRDAFMAELRAPGFCASIEPYAHAAENVGFLSIALGADVVIVTQPMSECSTWEAERAAWVEKHLRVALADGWHTDDNGAVRPGSTSVLPFVISTGHKHLIPGDLFVDDNPANVQAWQAAWPQGLGLLWSRPYNQNAPDCRRVRSWRAVHLAADWLRVAKYGWI